MIINTNCDEMDQGEVTEDLDYRTIKFNNAMSHELDRFETEAEAVKSAKTLHHPDWPCWQGIIVKDGDNVTKFDSSKQ